MHRKLSILLSYISLFTIHALGAGRVDTTKVFTPAQFAAYANQFKDRWFQKMLPADERLFVTGKMKALDVPEPLRTKRIKGLISGSACMVALNENARPAIYFAFACAALRPNDTLAANNVGGILRMLDSIPSSFKVLLYAKSLDPSSPMILTHLGNSTLELGDERTAEVFFTRALKIDPRFGQAHNGLALVWLKRGALGRAYEEMLTAATFGGYQPGVKEMYEEITTPTIADGFAHSNSDQYWDKFPLEEAKKLFMSQTITLSETPLVVLPQFPNWKNLESYNESSPELINKFTAANKSGKSFANANLKQAEERPVAPPQSTRISYEKQLFMIDAVGDYFMAVERKKDWDYWHERDKIAEKVQEENQRWMNLLQNDPLLGELEEAMKACTSSKDFSICEENALRAFCAKHCPRIEVHNQKMESLFKDWKSLAMNYGDHVQKSLNDYYKFTDPWMEQILDPNDFDAAKYKRELFARDMESFTIGGWVGIGGSKQPLECGHGTCSALDLQPIPDPDALKPPNKKKTQCPSGVKLKAGFESCEIGVDCSSIEIGCTKGVSGSAKFDFKDESVTLFGGFAAEAKLGKRSVSGKAGVFMTIGGPGAIDLGGKTEAATSKEYGPLGVLNAGTSQEYQWSIFSGAKPVETTKEYGIKFP
jgi:tetratricopeptide (TPR) repeat protein